jgi:hypothetical protein
MPMAWLRYMVNNAILTFYDALRSSIYRMNGLTGLVQR